MPIARNCTSCGAPLPATLGWCGSCFAPVKLHSARRPIHDPGGFVGTLEPTPRTSRWRAGPTSFGPVGRLVSTGVLALFFPWWGAGDAMNPFFLWSLMGWLVLAGIVLRSVWKRERIPEGPPTAVDRFRERHPTLGGAIRLTPAARVGLLVVAAVVAVAAWLAMDTAARYLWTAIPLLAGLGIWVATRNDL
jgi:hypothetical protein